VEQHKDNKSEGGAQPKPEQQHAARPEDKLEAKVEKKTQKGTHWDETEKQRFAECYKKYGRDWKAIALQFPSKTDKQLRNFYQNNKSKLNLHDVPGP
jgi:hypothetical protein